MIGHGPAPLAPCRPAHDHTRYNRASPGQYGDAAQKSGYARPGGGDPLRFTCSGCGRLAVNPVFDLCKKCLAASYCPCETCGDCVPLMMGKCPKCNKKEDEARPVYEVSLERDGKMLVASVPGLPGCYAYGPDLGFVTYQIEEAIWKRTGAVPRAEIKGLPGIACPPSA